MKLPRYHLIVFVLGSLGLLILFQLLRFSSVFWVLIGWGVAVMVHWMYSISVRVEDNWADQRADDLVNNAYDVEHIENIRKRRTANKKNQ